MYLDWCGAKRLGVLATMTLALSASASAAMVFTIDQNGCSGGGGCGTAPYGTVTLTQVNPTTVNVLVNLATGIVFADSSGEALTFEISSSVIGAITIDSFNSSDYGVGPAPRMASTFGTFDYSVSCVTCTGGNPGNPSGPMSFDVSAVSGLTIADFIKNGNGYYFATDIRGLNGNTGNVGVIFDPIFQDDVPEPATVAFSAAGLLGLIAIRRHRSTRSRT